MYLESGSWVRADYSREEHDELEDDLSVDAVLQDLLVVVDEFFEGRLGLFEHVAVVLEGVFDEEAEPLRSVELVGPVLRDAVPETVVGETHGFFERDDRLSPGGQRDVVESEREEADLDQDVDDAHVSEHHLSPGEWFCVELCRAGRVVAVEVFVEAHEEEQQLVEHAVEGSDVPVVEVFPFVVHDAHVDVSRVLEERAEEEDLGEFLIGDLLELHAARLVRYGRVRELAGLGHCGLRCVLLRCRCRSAD